jgi:hypothetical protein
MTAKRCPSKAEIIRYLEAEGAADGSEHEFLDHAAGCPECRVVLEAALEVGSGAESLLGDLAGLDLGSPGTVPRIRAQARREVRLLRAKRRRAWFAPRRWYAIPAAGAALALAAVLVFVPGKRQEASTGPERGSPAAAAGLMRPRVVVRADGLDFQWSREPGARTRRLEIYDRTLERVYQSAPLGQDRAGLPPGVLASLERGAVYFWRVVVTLDDDRSVESEFASFVLQK